MLIWIIVFLLYFVKNIFKFYQLGFVSVCKFNKYFDLTTDLGYDKVQFISTICMSDIRMTTERERVSLSYTHLSPSPPGNVLIHVPVFLLFQY